MSLHDETDLNQLVSGQHPARPNNTRVMKPMPVTVSGVSFVSTLWLIFTVIVLCALVVAAAFPNWMHNNVDSVEKRSELNNLLREVDVGLYHLCYTISRSIELNNNVTLRECSTYMQYSPPVEHDGVKTNLVEADLSDISFLFSASIVYAFAFLVLLISLIVGTVAYLRPKMKGTSLFAVAFVLQVVGGVALVVSLALLPVSFESEFMSQFCGEKASYYYRGMCTVDWALYVAMVVTACALYLPSMAIFSMNISDGLRANICC